jgi:hypothetical protein
MEDCLGKNVGFIDKCIRCAMICLFISLFIVEKLSMGTVVVLGIISIDLLVTAILGFDQIYAAFEISTRKRSIIMVRDNGRPTVKTASSMPIFLKSSAAIFQADMRLDPERDSELGERKVSL